MRFFRRSTGGTDSFRIRDKHQIPHVRQIQTTLLRKTIEEEIYHFLSCTGAASTKPVMREPLAIPFRAARSTGARKEHVCFTPVKQTPMSLSCPALRYNTVTSLPLAGSPSGSKIPPLSPSISHRERTFTQYHSNRARSAKKEEVFSATSILDFRCVRVSHWVRVSRWVRVPHWE